MTGKAVTEEKSDAKLDELKKQMTCLTDKGLTNLLKATQQEIANRKKAKKPATIEVAETSK